VTAAFPTALFFTIAAGGGFGLKLLKTAVGKSNIVKEPYFAYIAGQHE
jgi:hypothetical protein